MSQGRTAHPARFRFALWAGLLAMGALSTSGTSKGAPRSPRPGSLPPSTLEEPVTGMTLLQIPAGSFEMGSPVTEPMREAQERLHTVRLSRPFYLGATEVTQEQWERVLGRGHRPSQAAACGPRCPVENVNFDEIQEFLRRLNAKASGPPFRLPTEAEWEYACRAGTTTAFATGSSLTTDQANFHGGHPSADGKVGSFLGKPTPVGSFPPNRWGLFDMHGNVWEWCQDWHCPYGAGKVTDPQGQCASRVRVIRGGSWAFSADNARCALRYTHSPQDRGPSLGFRVARDVMPWRR
ncbi:MAG TPA: formylglycine-generating enzyme family protein [Vicinamibacteria bacterium]